MDHAGRQVLAASSSRRNRARPASSLAERLVDVAARAVEQWPPAGDRQRVGPLERKVAAGQMQRRPAPRRPARNAARSMRRGDRPCRNVVIAAGLPAQRAHRVAVAAMDRLRAVDAARREMIHQAEEERQVLGVDALLVEREEVLAARRGQQVVGVLDTLGDALEGHRLRRCRIRRERLRARCRRLRCRPPSGHQLRRGSLNTTLSSVVRTSSTVTS